MLPTSISSAEEEIDQLVDRVERLQIDLTQTGIDEIFERNRLLLEIDTTQRRILYLDRLVREELIKALQYHPNTITQAKAELDLLFVKVRDLHFRIDTISLRGLARSKLLAQKAWLSARIDFLDSWINQQKQTTTTSNPIPPDLTGARFECDKLVREIKAIEVKLRHFLKNDRSSQRAALIRQKMEREQRLAFLRRQLNEQNVNTSMGLKLTSSEGLDYALDILIDILDKETNQSVSRDQRRLDVWNALRMRIGFRSFQLNVRKTTRN